MCKVDLKDVYFAILPSAKSRKYVRFQWRILLYEFCCLCFGFSSAPLTFTKLLSLYFSFSIRFNVRIIFTSKKCPEGIFIRGLLDGKRYTYVHTLTLRVSVQYQKVLPRTNIDLELLGLIVDSGEINLSLLE